MIAVRIRAELADGRVVEGPVKGPGGFAGGGALHAGPERARRAALRQVMFAQNRFINGLDTGLYEPTKGHIVMCPDFSAEGNGKDVEVPLSGTIFSLPQDEARDG